MWWGASVRQAGGEAFIGAYGRAMASSFNGYGQYDEVILFDEPQLTMYAEDAAAPARLARG